MMDSLVFIPISLWSPQNNWKAINSNRCQDVQPRRYFTDAWSCDVLLQVLGYFRC